MTTLSPAPYDDGARATLEPDAEREYPEIQRSGAVFWLLLSDLALAAGLLGFILVFLCLAWGVLVGVTP